MRFAKLLAVYEEASRALLPNTLTIATEDYILSRRLFMYTNPKPKASVVDFIQFTLSDAGQRVVASTGFISQAIAAVQTEFSAELPIKLQYLRQNAQRLTVNFRFEQGGARLDNKALKDIRRLVEYMQNNPASELLLVGFGDPQKTEVRSQLLSRLRAMAVRRELMRQGVGVTQALGFGDDLLVAGINANKSRVRNRRVEVWVR